MKPRWLKSAGLLREWGDALAVTSLLVGCLVVAYANGASGQLPTPTPTPDTPHQHPLEGTGDWRSPSEWGKFTSEVGIPAALLCLSVAGNVWFIILLLKRGKEPDNSAQGAALLEDARNRNQRLRKVLRAECEVQTMFAEMVGCTDPVKIEQIKRDIKTQLGKIQDALDEEPPPIPKMFTLNKDGA